MKTAIKILSCVLILINVTSCEKYKYSPTANLPSTVSFSKNIVPILDQNCFTCHGASGSKAMTPPVLEGINAYKNLIEAADTINPDTSDLYLMVSGKARNPMPPDPNKLSDYDIQVILKWMKQGARNN